MLSTSLSGASTFSWSGLLLTFLNLNSPSCRQLWSQRLDTLFSPDKLFLISSWSLESDLISAAFRWRLSWHPSLWASLFLETFFSWHSLLSTSHTLDTVFAWHHFSCFPLLHFYFETSLCQNCFLWHLLSWHLLCLEAVVHSHIFVPCEQNSSCVIQDLHKVLPVPRNLSKEFSRTIYLVLQSLHKVLPSTTSYYKACTKYFPVLLRTTKLAPSTSQYYSTSYYNLSTSLLSPSLISPHSYSLHLKSLHIPTLSISSLSSSLLSPSLISPHPHSHQLCSWYLFLLWLFNCCDDLFLPLDHIFRITEFRLPNFLW